MGIGYYYIEFLRRLFFHSLFFFGEFIVHTIPPVLVIKRITFNFTLIYSMMMRIVK